MNRNPLQTIFSKKFWLVCIAVGIFLLGIVFALSRQADMQNCEQRLAGAIEFIKEQAADYTKYNETAIAKGLVREAAAVRALESLSLDCDEAALSERARGCGLRASACWTRRASWYVSTRRMASATHSFSLASNWNRSSVSSG